MSTYLGAGAELGPSTSTRPSIEARGGHLPRGLPLGPAARPRRRSATRPRSPHRRRPPGRAHALRPVLRRPPPRRVPRARRARRRHPVRQRGRDLDALRGRHLRRGAAPACAATARSRRSRAAPQGSVIVAGDDVHVIDADPVDSVVDTTGAGDLYAAGFLYGLTHGHDLATCGRLGVARGGRGDLAPRRAPGGVARRARAPLLELTPVARLPRYRTGDPELDERIAELIARARRRPRRRPRVRADRVGGAARARPRVARRPQDRERRAEGDALRVPGVRAVPRRRARSRSSVRRARRRDDPLYEQTVALAARARRGRLDGDHRRRARDHGGRASRARARRTRSA